MTQELPKEIKVDEKEFDFIPVAPSKEIKVDENFDFIPNPQELRKKAVYDTCKVLVPFLKKPKVTLIMRDTSEEILEEVKTIFQKRGYTFTYQKNMKKFGGYDNMYENPFLNIFGTYSVKNTNTIAMNSYTSSSSTTEEVEQDGFILKISI